MPKYTRSPLRYPGSKRDLEDAILAFIPPFKEFREPFFGSGAISLRVAQTRPDARIRGWDLHYDLVTFWNVLAAAQKALAERVREIHAAGLAWRDLEVEVKARLAGSLPPLERAALYFVANRSSWCGGGIVKGFTENAHETLFTPSSITRLLTAAPLARRIEVVEGDYADALQAPGDDVFIFLDPPYVAAVTGHLYGKRHDLFDHERFLRDAEACPHPLLITYDDHEVVREMFNGSHWFVEPLPVMYRSRRNEKTTELMIANYDLRAVATVSAA